MNERVISVDFDKENEEIKLKVNGEDRKLKLTLWAAIKIEEEYGSLQEFYKNALSPRTSLKALVYIINADLRIYRKENNATISDVTEEELMSRIEDKFEDITDSVTFCNAIQRIIVKSSPTDDGTTSKKKTTKK